MNDSAQTATTRSLAEIWQYPFKGFLASVMPALMSSNQLLPDRRFAVSNGNPVSHEKLNEGWLNKRHFIQLLTEPRLAGLTLTYDSTNDAISYLINQVLPQQR